MKKRKGGPMMREIQKHRPRGARCKVCGRNAGQSGGPLHFHHLDPSTKVFEVTQYTGRTLSELRQEIAKCVLLCKRCHRQAHSRDGGVAVLHDHGGRVHLTLTQGREVYRSFGD